MKPESLKAMERDLKVILDEATGPAASKFLADTWRGAHNEVMDEGRRRARVDPGFTVAADNDQRKPPEQARNIIVSNYDYRREVANATMDALDKASPKQSGAYVRAHTIFVNGKPVGKVCPPISLTDQLFIANPMPYARRLEIGRTKSGRSFVLQVPSRIYERVAKSAITPQYRNVAKISFRYVDLTGAHVITGGLGGSYLVEGTRHGVGPGAGRAVKRRQKVGEKIRFPAIFIEAM